MCRYSQLVQSLSWGIANLKGLDELVLVQTNHVSKDLIDKPEIDLEVFRDFYDSVHHLG